MVGPSFCSLSVAVVTRRKPNTSRTIVGVRGGWLSLWEKQHMAAHNKKQFGIWMDGHQATVAGRNDPESNTFEIIGHVKNPGTSGNSNENANNHHEVALRHKFFKEIAAIMPNVDEVHVTGTGQAQEQFIHFLADTPQYKNTVATESTSNQMGDEQLVEFIGKHFDQG